MCMSEEQILIAGLRRSPIEVQWEGEAEEHLEDYGGT